MSAPSYRELVRAFLDLRWQLDPVAATQAGVREHDARLGAFTRADAKRALAALKATSAAFEEADAADLDEEIDQTAVLDDLRVTIARLERERPHELNPEFHLSHLLGAYFSLLSRADRPVDERALALAARLAATPRFLAEAKETLTRPPQVFTETALKVAEGGRSLLREGIPAFAAGASPEGRAALGDGLAAAREALEDFIAFLVGDLAQRSDGEFAIGREAFDFRLHYEHALREGAPEILRFGLRLVEEAQADLARRAESLAPGTPWRDLVERLRESRPLGGELVDAYAGEMERGRRFVLERDLAAVPTGALAVVATPAFMVPLVPFAAYEPPGAFAEDRTGTFYITVPADAGGNHCAHEVAATALHEGYPGHHLQHLVAQSLPSPVRRVVWTPLTVEGWAHYCETLMDEEGFHERPEDGLFHALHILWRAARVVLDVRLHTDGMSLADAERYLRDLLGLSAPEAEAEVRRYCAAPAYQLCYAVGRRELLRLRDDRRAQLGSAFSLRRFHDEVLSYGGLPLALVRWGMGS